MATQTSNTSSSAFFGCLFSLVALGLVVWWILPSRWTNPLLYSIEYGVSTSQVQWNDQPSDCDFSRAPLGYKGCHYKKSVSGFNAAGNIVSGDNAPIYSHDKNTGKPIISNDSGKTWDWLPEGTPFPDSKVTRVEIWWTKVEE